MAYLSRCQHMKTIPALSRLVGNSFIHKPLAPTVALRTYASTTSLAKNAARLALVQKQSKLPGALTLFANQVRSSSTGDHVRLWQIERLVSAAFIVLLPACILLQNIVVDSAFSILVVMHAHWGLEALILDYARPAVVGPIVPKAAHLLLYLISAASLAGLLALSFNGPGVGGSIRKLWSIGQKEDKH